MLKCRFLFPECYFGPTVSVLCICICLVCLFVDLYYRLNINTTEQIGSKFLKLARIEEFSAENFLIWTFLGNPSLYTGCIYIYIYTIYTPCIYWWISQKCPNQKVFRAKFFNSGQLQNLLPICSVVLMFNL